MSMVSVYQYIVTLNDNIVDKVSPAVAEGIPTVAGSTSTQRSTSTQVAGVILYSIIYHNNYYVVLNR